MLKECTRSFEKAVALIIAAYKPNNSKQAMNAEQDTDDSLGSLLEDFAKCDRVLRGAE